MENGNGQGELFTLSLKRYPYRLRANDLIRIGGRLGLVLRVNDCAAVVLVNRPPRQFTTRFDKKVRLQPSPVTFRISANSETEIVHRQKPKTQRRKK